MFSVTYSNLLVEWTGIEPAVRPMEAVQPSPVDVELSGIEPDIHASSPQKLAPLVRLDTDISRLTIGRSDSVRPCFITPVHVLELLRHLAVLGGLEPLPSRLTVLRAHR